MKTGTVKWFNQEKKYGFIVEDEPTEKGAEVFVHQRNVSPAGTLLKENDKVSYETEITPKGLNALSVQLVS